MDSVDHQWVEVPCQRAVNDANFAQGVMDYQFSISRPQGWIPSQSYFRVELELLGAGDPAAAAQPLFREQVAFAENAVGNLISNVYVRAGGQDVSSITSFAPQASMLQMRTGKTHSWLKSTGREAWGMSGSFAERCAAVSQSAAGIAANAAPIGLSGLDDRRELTYRPCAVGQFNSAHLAFAGGVVAGTATAFTAGDVGNTLVYEGARYTVAGFTNATVIALSPIPVDLAPNAANTNWYMIRRNVTRSAQARNRVFVLWRPPVGLFDADDVILGSGDYRISLTPDSNFQNTGVETINDAPLPGVTGVAASTFTLSVKSLQFYAATVKMSIPDSVQELHLREYSVQSRVMNSNVMNFSFSVPASTSCLHLFLQDNLAGSSARVPPSNFKVLNGSDLNLQVLQLTYDNVTLPATRWASGHIANSPAGRNTSLLQQLYHQSLVARRAENNPGGSETFSEWLDRGPLYSFYFSRDASSRSTDVQVTIQYNDPTAGIFFDQSSKLFLVAEADRTVEITTANGMVTAVRSLNI